MNRDNQGMLLGQAADAFSASRREWMRAILLLDHAGAAEQVEGIADLTWGVCWAEQAFIQLADRYANGDIVFVDGAENESLPDYVGQASAQYRRERARRRDQNFQYDDAESYLPEPKWGDTGVAA